MFQVPVTTDIATSTDNLRMETATQVASSLSQKAQTQTGIVLAELEEVLQKQKSEIKKSKATIIEWKKKNTRLRREACCTKHMICEMKYKAQS
jgi:hypothetical protein